MPATEPRWRTRFGAVEVVIGPLTPARRAVPTDAQGQCACTADERAYGHHLGCVHGPQRNLPTIRTALPIPDDGRIWCAFVWSSSRRGLELRVWRVTRFARGLPIVNAMTWWTCRLEGHDHAVDQRVVDDRGIQTWEPKPALCGRLVHPTALVTPSGPRCRPCAAMITRVIPTDTVVEAARAADGGES